MQHFSLTITRPNRHQLLHVWALIQRELIYLGWAVMECALLTPFSMAVMRWARYWPPNWVFVWLLVLMLLPFTLARLFAALKMPGSRQQWWMGFALIVVILQAISVLIYNGRAFYDFSWLPTFYENLAQTNNLLWLRDLSLFALVVLAWWRGLRLSQRTFTVKSIGLRLRLGGLLAAPVIIWLGAQRLVWNPAPYLLLFFLTALSVLALIRAEEIERDRSGLSASLGPEWLAMIFAASFLCVFTAASLTIIVSGQSAVLISGWLAPLWLALSFGFTVVTTTFTYVAFPALVGLGDVIMWLSGILAALMRVNLFGGISAPTREPLPGELATPAPPVDIPALFVLNNGLKVLIILLMILLVVLVTFALTRLYGQTAVADAEGHRLKKEDTDNLNKPGLGQRLLSRLGLLRQWRLAASIRRIYQEMVKSAAAVGYPRLEAETPYEYLHTLAKTWPDHQEETRLLTEAFVKIRYGELPETKEELDAIIAAWERLEKARPLHAPE